MGVALYRSTRIDREYLPFFPTTTWRRCSLSLFRSFALAKCPNLIFIYFDEGDREGKRAAITAVAAGADCYYHRLPFLNMLVQAHTHTHTYKPKQ